MCVLKKGGARKELVVLLNGCTSETAALDKRQRPHLRPTRLSPAASPFGDGNLRAGHPSKFRGFLESISELSREINCFAGYKAQNVLRDETKILRVFLTLKECRVLAWGWGPREGGPGPGP